MTPTCIAFEIKNDKIEVIEIDTPNETVGAALHHLSNNFWAQIPTVENLTPAPQKINPDHIIIKDISHIDLAKLIGVDNLPELENLYQRSERNKTLEFTDPNVPPHINNALRALQEHGTMTAKEILYIMSPNLVGQL
jgi:hypothetical protein